VPLPPAPMLATAGKLPTNAQGWVVEAKLDGCRCIARVYGEGAQLFSRPGNQLSTRFPEITAALATALHGRTAILDGEIVTPDRRTGAPCFELLQRRLAVTRPRFTLLASIPATMCVFDIVNLDGADLTRLTYLQPHQQPKIHRSGNNMKYGQRIALCCKVNTPRSGYSHGVLTATPARAAPDELGQRGADLVRAVFLDEMHTVEASPVSCTPRYV